MFLSTLGLSYTMFALMCLVVSLSQVLGTEDLYYIKACYPWFHPSIDFKNSPENCTLGCSLHMPHIGVTQQEVALCLRDGRTAISCTSNSDCSALMESAMCKRAYCLCEEKGLDRFYTLVDNADTTARFCAASADLHSIHIPLVLFPWKTLMIVFGTVALTGFLLMTLKWVLPIITTIREYQNPEASLERLRAEETLAEAFRNTLTQQGTGTTSDKPPAYETAVELQDSLPSYEDSLKGELSLNIVPTTNEVDQSSHSASNVVKPIQDSDPLLSHLQDIPANSASNYQARDTSNSS